MAGSRAFRVFPNGGFRHLAIWEILKLSAPDTFLLGIDHEGKRSRGVD